MIQEIMDETLGDLFPFLNQWCGSNEINSVHTHQQELGFKVQWGWKQVLKNFEEVQKFFETPLAIRGKMWESFEEQK